MDFEIEAFYPQYARSSAQTETAERLKQRLILTLDGIITGSNKQKEIEKIDEYLFNLHQPERFDGPEGVEVKMKKGFDETCLALQTHGIFQPRNLSVREFLGAIEMLKKKNG